jgi:hypothetical protein
MIKLISDKFTWQKFYAKNPCTTQRGLYPVIFSRVSKSLKGFSSNANERKDLNKEI